jgi:hypothetical protein
MMPEVVAILPMRLQIYSQQSVMKAGNRAAYKVTCCNIRYIGTYRGDEDSARALTNVYVAGVPLGL